MAPTTTQTPTTPTPTKKIARVGTSLKKRVYTPEQKERRKTLQNRRRLSNPGSRKKEIPDRKSLSQEALEELRRKEKLIKREQRAKIKAKMSSNENQNPPYTFEQLKELRELELKKARADAVKEAQQASATRVKSSEGRNKKEAEAASEFAKVLFADAAVPTSVSTDSATGSTVSSQTQSTNSTIPKETLRAVQL